MRLASVEIEREWVSIGRVLVLFSDSDRVASAGERLTLVMTCPKWPLGDGTIALRRVVSSGGRDNWP